MRSWSWIAAGLVLAAALALSRHKTPSPQVHADAGKGGLTLPEHFLKDPNSQPDPKVGPDPAAKPDHDAPPDQR